MKIKKILSTMVAFAMIGCATMVPVSAAEPSTLDLAAGSVTITATGYTQGEGAAETPYVGAYTVTAAAGNTNTITVAENSGEISMTIENLNITAADSAAMRVESGTTLNLTVNGENNILQGATGYAGISVAAAWAGDSHDPDNSGKLVITEESTGTLNVSGGDAGTAVGGGAGIGGDGLGTSNPDGADFGVVEINGGAVNATGGAAVSYKYGAGAGIGGGGIDGNVDYDGDGYFDTWSYAGSITITGGTVTATGGAAYSDGCGAAGIGGGAALASGGSTSCGTLPINITGGEVTAHGATDAAGIGGSTAGAHGNITITGGEVTAYGGDEGVDSGYGGAGIGGGDAAGGETITIGGTANVTAYGGCSAAGIGGGNGGYSNEIIIEENADVTAYGGYCGAGIGSGNGAAFYTPQQHMAITLNTAGNIVAYGGGYAQSIGFGYPEHRNKDCTVTIGENNTGKIFAFNKNNYQSAINGLNTDNTVDEGALTLEGTNALYWNAGESSAWFKFGAASDNTTHTWTADGTTLTLTSGEKTVATVDYDAERFDPACNWAVIQNDTDYLTANLYFTDVTTDEDRENGVAKFDLVFEGSSFDMVKNFVSGEFITTLTPTTAEDGPFEYVLEPYSDEMVFYYDTNADGTRKYHINLQKFIEAGASDASYTTTDDSDTYEKSIHLGVMTVTGYGKGKITISDDNTLLMEKHDDTSENLAKTIITKVGNPAEFNIVPPTRKLTVKIKFNNTIKPNEVDYQDMTVTISGGDITAGNAESHVFKLGNQTEGAVVWSETDQTYTVTDTLTKNVLYNVTIKGAGYRTTYHAFSMTDDKTLNFWNNVKDVPVAIEDGKTEVTNNFLAGDIVDDKNINIYDLSAVVSYFGSNATTQNGYAKYDLNRDGVIDSKDVAYVLVSWGK